MRKSMRLPALLLAFIMVVGLLPTTRAYAGSANLPPITVTVNGQLVTFPDQLPIMVDNRVLVPVGGVFEMMGFVPSWDPVQRIARLTRHDITVVIPAASTSFVVNGVVITPEVPQRIVNDRLMLPLRAVAEAVGGVPNWDAVNRRAMITTPLAPTASPTPTPTSTPTPSPTPGATPVPLLTAVPRFEGSPGFALGGNADMAGNRYANSIWGGGHSQHNLAAANGFATLTGRIGRLDGSGAGARTIRFIGDGTVLASYTVTGYTFVPINVAIDVRNVSILRIEIEAAGNDGVSVVLGTPMLHRTQATAPIPTPRPSPSPGATPAPLLTAAPRVDGSAGFGFGGTATIGGVAHTGALWGGGWSTHNLNGRFTTLTGVIGRLDGSGAEARNIRFLTGYGRLIATHTVTGTDAARNISVNVQGVTTLRIEIDTPGTNGVSVVFGNTMLHPTTANVTTTPAPLLTAAPRVDGSAGFGFGGTANIGGVAHTGALWGGGWSTHNLNGRFTTLTGVIGRLDGSGAEARNIRFLTGYGRLIATHTIMGTDAARNISVNVQGVNVLRIEIDTPGTNGVSIVFGNTMLHPTTTNVATTPAPLLTAAPRVDGSAGFGFGGTANIGGVSHTGALWGGGWSTHNLNGRFTTLTGVIGRLDGSGAEARNIRFSTGYGRHIATHTVSGADAARSISVNVQGVNTLRIEIDAPGYHGVSVVFGNTMLHPTNVVATPTPAPTPIPTPPPVSTPAPLFSVASRVDGTPGFGTGGQTVFIGSTQLFNTITPLAGYGSNWATYNLGGRFTTLTADIGRQDNVAGTQQRILRFLNDSGVIIASFTVDGTGASVRPITVNVSGVNNLRVEMYGPGTQGVSIVMGNIMVSQPVPLVNTPRRGGTGTLAHPGQSFNIGGTLHHNSIWGGGDVVFELNNRFTVLETHIGGRSGAEFTGTERRYIRFYGDGRFLGSHHADAGHFSPRLVTVDVTGVVNLTIQIAEVGTNGVVAALGNPRVR